MPFRETHHISGAAVKLAEDKGCELDELTVADLAGIHSLFTDDVTEVRDGRLYPPMVAKWPLAASTQSLHPRSR